MNIITLGLNSAHFITMGIGEGTTPPPINPDQLRLGGNVRYGGHKRKKYAEHMAERLEEGRREIGLIEPVIESVAQEIAREEIAEQVVHRPLDRGEHFELDDVAIKFEVAQSVARTIPYRTARQIAAEEDDAVVDMILMGEFDYSDSEDDRIVDLIVRQLQ